MDNDLYLKGRGLTKRKKFISQGEIGYAVSEAALQERETSASHPTECSAFRPLFPLKRGGFKPELFNYLIINYSVNIYKKRKIIYKTI